VSPICPCCNSADTVGYWDIKANQGDSLTVLMLKRHYPNARKCVDCEHVWWRDPIRLPDLATLQVEKAKS
jgi:hypothetical protein